MLCVHVNNRFIHNDPYTRCSCSFCPEMFLHKQTCPQLPQNFTLSNSLLIINVRLSDSSRPSGSYCWPYGDWTVTLVVETQIWPNLQNCSLQKGVQIVFFKLVNDFRFHGHVLDCNNTVYGTC